MKINETDFVAEAEAETYAHKTITVPMADLQKQTAKTLAPLVQFVEAAINSDKIASADLQVSDAEVLVQLQTSIINLPLAYGKNIHKIMVDDGEVDVNVYMIIAAPAINKSKLRIDELLDATTFVKQPDQALDQFTAWMQTQLAVLADHEAEATAD
ncbi:hypothetical protein M3M35_03970 [Fructilactobacillus myrtifloralis]|uniref:Uncharacterized protein n=1 Tax=Fructilactobacillus myrtifloralis TaxID=2940301 RepID=A0ABY5BLI9_9LACO|nr:hypothetical protein [Fructilactobacillus myrtifloralis]USS84482.1 hypothetical protein M3M35_03970 [Fructilactobacillus myrtifloralis]